jgi:carboxyl-terminal processing protease
LLVLVLVLAFAPAAFANGSYAERFDLAWRLVDERYWGLDRLDIDWNEIRAEYRPRALAAADEDAFYRVLEEMYDELGDDHSVYVSPTRVDEIRRKYGDLPCLGVFGQAGAGEDASGRVRWSIVGDGVGYIALPDLATPGVATSVREAVRALVGRGAAGLVLDLRGNPGGRLVEMMQVAGVFTDGFLWRTLTDWTLPLPYPALGRTETDLPLVVLTDGGVNSAAEGLAGALQRQGRALVLGERTAGNVEAVLPFCLRDGSQAWIATGVLAPIGGPTWEGVGVEPDVPVAAAEALDRAVDYLQKR